VALFFCWRQKLSFGSNAKNKAMPGAAGPAFSFLVPPPGDRWRSLRRQQSRRSRASLFFFGASPRGSLEELATTAIPAQPGQPFLFWCTRDRHRSETEMVIPY
jgi:hypothetical protein